MFIEALLRTISSVFRSVRHPHFKTRVQVLGPHLKVRVQEVVRELARSRTPWVEVLLELAGPSIKGEVHKFRFSSVKGIVIVIVALHLLGALAAVGMSMSMGAVGLRRCLAHRFVEVQWAPKIA